MAGDVSLILEISILPLQKVAQPLHQIFKVQAGDAEQEACATDLVGGEAVCKCCCEELTQPGPFWGYAKRGKSPGKPAATSCSTVGTKGGTCSRQYQSVRTVCLFEPGTGRLAYSLQLQWYILKVTLVCSAEGAPAPVALSPHPTATLALTSTLNPHATLTWPKQTQPLSLLCICHCL